MPAVVNRDMCNACVGHEKQECVFHCPYDAVALVDGKASVDANRCDDCRICVEMCPVGAIALE